MSDENDDWPSFIAKVAELIRAGATTESLTRMFVGSRVRWTGILNDVDPDDRAAVVGIRMGECKDQLQQNLGARISAGVR